MSHKICEECKTLIKIGYEVIEKRRESIISIRRILDDEIFSLGDLVVDQESGKTRNFPIVQIISFEEWEWQPNTITCKIGYREDKALTSIFSLVHAKNFIKAYETNV